MSYFYFEPLDSLVSYMIELTQNTYKMAHIDPNTYEIEMAMPTHPDQTLHCSFSLMFTGLRF